MSADWDRLWATEPLDPRAGDWEARTLRWHQQTLMIVERFSSFEGLQVVELGAGRGTNALLYAQSGADVTLVDLSPLALEQGRRLFAADGLTPTCIESDVLRLPKHFRRSFDVCVSFGLCEHFVGSSRIAALRAHLDVLKRGGVAFVSVPNRWAPIYRAWMAVEKARGTWRFGTEVPFSASELRSLARLSGGVPVEVLHGSFVANLVEQGINAPLHRVSGKRVRAPHVALPLLDNLAYELMVAMVPA